MTLPISEFPLRRVEGIIQKVRHYCYSGRLHFPGENDELYCTEQWSDYEGYPFSDVVQLVSFPRGTKPLDHKEHWRLHIVYSGTLGDTYDYKKKASKDNSTAFKIRPAGPEQEVKFKIEDNYSILASKSNREPLIKQSLLWLEGRLGELDQLATNLLHWADSEHKMVVFCRNFYCQRRSILPASKLRDLANKGMTFGELSEKLVCKKCGKKNPQLFPDVGIPAH